MGLGRMDTRIDIVTAERVKDREGFTVASDSVLASVRAYHEDQHSSRAWANRAAFTNASALFRFRRIPGLVVDTSMSIVCPSGRYKIVSVEDIKGRGMYQEVLTEKSVPSGKG